jgi:hypothetical protein
MASMSWTVLSVSMNGQMSPEFSSQPAAYARPLASIAAHSSSLSGVISTSQASG